MEPQNQLEILLHHTPVWWLAEFRGSIGGKVREVAGCDTVATGFNGHVPAHVVCSAIAMLNPDARVRLVDEPPSTIVQRAAALTAAPAKAAADKDNPKDQLLALASDIVGNYQRGAPAPAPRVDRDAQDALERAKKIRKGLGLMVACSFLRERGWSFESAQKALAQP